MFSSDVPEEAAPDSQHADINAAVFFLIIDQIFSFGLDKLIGVAV